jgi:hypothetical protein
MAGKVRYFYIKRRTIWFLAFILIVLLTLSIQLTLFFPFKQKQDTSLQNQTQKKYMIYVDVENCKLYLLENGACTREYWVSPGAWDTPTPLGLYKIIFKDTWGEGFGGYWMGLDIPWGQYGIHGTIFPELLGSHASHGCIRMRNEQIKELYDIIPLGTSVFISDGPYGPFGQEFRTLQFEDQGCDVLVVQKRLKKLGFYKGYPDGIFGNGTLESIHLFQKAKKLPIKDTIEKPEYQAMRFIEMD